MWKFWGNTYLVWKQVHNLPEIMRRPQNSTSFWNYLVTSKQSRTFFQMFVAFSESLDCVETQVFETSSSFIYTALVSRIFLDVFSCYNLKMSQRSECKITFRSLGYLHPSFKDETFKENSWNRCRSYWLSLVSRIFLDVLSLSFSLLQMLVLYQNFVLRVNILSSI